MSASFLNKIKIDPKGLNTNIYPFNIPWIKKEIILETASNVTFFVGENGVGKSSILEGVADYCGFNLSGGNKNHNYGKSTEDPTLAAAMTLYWKSKISQGFFMRAESFYNFATYIDQLESEEKGIFDAYGGKSLHHQSHGESFLSLFNNRFSKGIYILDEPEAALSPNRQFAFMMLMSELEKSGQAQFIIATHSPILLCYPKATIFLIEANKIKKVLYEDTEHFQFTKSFLNSPENFLRHL